MSNETTTACASGCTTTGQHTTSCTDPQCRGCLPRPADTGTICTGCRRWLERDTIDTPVVVHHLRELARPYPTIPAPDTNGARHPAASAPLLSELVDAADDLHATLHAWARLVADERHLHGPSAAGIRYTTPTVRTLDGVAFIHPAEPAGITTATATMHVAAWLLPHLDYAAGRTWAADMRTELRTRLATLHARWPTDHDTAHPYRVAIPCPRCDQLSLTYTPPTWARQPFRVECTNDDCARVFTEDEWDRFKALVLRGHRGVVA